MSRKLNLLAIAPSIEHYEAWLVVKIVITAGFV